MEVPHENYFTENRLEEKEKDKKVLFMDMALLNKSKLKVVDQEVLLFYKYFTLFEILVETIDQNPGGGEGPAPPHPQVLRSQNI